MKIIATIILSLLLIGCATNTQDSLEFENNLKQFSSTSVSKAHNTLFIGTQFPQGRVIRLNYSRARQLQSILSSAKYAQANSSNYEADLCYLEIAGRTWYFRPPFKPYGFTLPREEQKQMENILKNGYGLR